MITPIECEMLTTVARTKCYDKIFEQEGVEEMEIQRCSTAYKTQSLPQYQVLLLEVQKLHYQLVRN